MKEEITLDDNLVEMAIKLCPEKSLNTIVNDAMKAYLEFLKVQKNYEATDKKVIENWGSSHYIDPSRDTE